MNERLTHEDIAFLANVKDYITTHPAVAAYISDYVAQGIQEALLSQRELASDMEAALLYSLRSDKKLKKEEYSFVKDTLTKWRGKSWLRWDWFFEKEKANEQR